LNILVISGSRNPQGQTARAVGSFIKGLEAGGGATETVFLPPLTIERCRQCEDDGWGLCKKEGKCIIEDDFSGLLEKLRNADAAAFATPVYFADLSESLKAFLDRLRRIMRNDAAKPGIAAKPAAGICVAGGRGGGSPSCCFLLERTLTTIGFDVLDMVPVRRQNLAMKLPILEAAGKNLAIYRPSAS
jgi:multimeric flavodoxin WrbA